MEYREKRPGKLGTKKRLVTLLTALSFLIQLIIAPAIVSADDDVPVDTSKYKPVIQFANSVSVSGTAGETLKINLHIKNTSSYGAKSIRVKPELDADSPFLTNNSTTGIIDELIPNGTDIFTIPLIFLPMLRKRSIPLNLTLITIIIMVNILEEALHLRM